MNDYERMRQPHHDGMCGGACQECLRDQQDYDERRQAEYPPTDEERCADGDHVYAGDEGEPPQTRGRCYCGQKDYPVGGP